MSFRDEEEDDTTMPCPYCKEPVYEDAERCPHCENYLSLEDAPSHHPWWLVLGVIVCLIIALGWVFGR
jgi:hypothetical protein